MQWDNEAQQAQATADLNRIARFLARRDLPALSRSELLNTCGTEQADLLILLGSSILNTVEQAAEAFQNGLAKEFMIVGGTGHSTSFLQESVKQTAKYAAIDVQHRSEAEILLDAAVIHAGVRKEQVILETESTHCGNNASNALAVLQKMGRTPRRVILMQDPTLQQRTFATFQQAWRSLPDIEFINYAAFVPQLKAEGKTRTYDLPGRIGPVWEMEHFISLIMGEIPRLCDNEEGYGPRGKGYIVHVDIPEEVMSAYRRLLPHYGAYIRKAVPEPARQDRP
ncbi:ElyC/SanA/YdcF family protein [Paenibacillus tyrfis]|uniref:ElyC/SanA/YdcF family protein n=1 Tax=Paenibacillus tyrfis TaxID=1501230 RepID=UPI0015C602D5|nr:ElyC/SanA/YdcF family protein [Paenibacillus tyrfis]